MLRLEPALRGDGPLSGRELLGARKWRLANPNREIGRSARLRRPEPGDIPIRGYPETVKNVVPLQGTRLA